MARVVRSAPSQRAVEARGAAREQKLAARGCAREQKLVARGLETIAPPAGLRISELDFGHERYMVLSYPVPRWTLPAVLTAAETEVVRAILAGESREAVAKARGSSLRTVANLLAQAFRKLGVRSRVELALFCSRADSPASAGLPSTDPAKE
jgi:DNA-binding NarL/FixJ family response regulator